MSTCNCDKRGDEPLWTGSYRLVKKCNSRATPVQLNVTADAVHLVQTRSSQCFPMDEIVSCTIVANDEDEDNEDGGSGGDHRQKKNSNGCCGGRGKNRGQRLLKNQVAIRLMIINRKSPCLERKEVLILIQTSDDFVDNHNEAQRLKNKLDPLINKGHATTKPILVILNPISGKGKASKIFEKKVRPLLDDFHLKYQLLTTKHANHATEFIRNQDNLSETYSAVVTVSGDGLLFEVVNGFVGSAIDKVPIPLSIIPGGSGNGLACSLNSIFLNGSRSTNELLDSILHLVKGQPTLMDLVLVRTPAKIYYSFLSVGWGFMADIDIESERLRCLGEVRFTLWSLYRAFAVRKNRGTLSYLPRDHPTNEIAPLAEPVPECWTTIKDEFVLVYAAYQRYLSSTVLFVPEAKLDDATIYLVYIKGGVSACQVIQFLLHLETGSHAKLPFVHFIPVKAFRLVPDSTNDILTVDGEQIPCSALQAEIIPKKATILLRSN